ncbi:ABC transporter ATP-binding protein [Salinithrix halophila]|uniref:Dipeptide ABC transporter ATP-binding protein n=1 Tax=Salinithrix halophila TaxID=1485204 RepID=A0ABV8JHP6_9BACL
MDTLLEVRDLRISFDTYVGEVQAVRGVSFDLKKGETLAIVGESGSGKSVLSKSILRLVPQPSGKIKTGKIWLDGENLLTLPKRKMERIRGAEISMILQDPMTSLNPTMTIGRQIMESLRIHQQFDRRKAAEKAVELLKRVGIPWPEGRMKQYPHQLSGGMRQRVVIAIALACNPKILIADEPTTALDVTIQAQILELLKEIQKQLGMSLIFITHDLGVVAHMADRVAVMYAGKIVEIGKVDEIFYNPKHPYTWGLLASVPDPGSSKDLAAIPGSPPDLLHPPQGDAFALRNEYAMNIDFRMEPPMFPITETHYAATWLLHDNAPPIDPPALSAKRKDQPALQSDTNRERPVAKVPLLQVRNLKKYFHVGNQVIKAVDDLNFEIYKGETFGLVGESGCGKSTTGRMLMRLYDKTEGQVIYDGVEIHGTKTEEWSRRFHRRAQMIFQDPYSSLDPRQTVADIVAEGMDIHGLAKDPEERLKKVYHLLETVGLSRDHAYHYPHEFSGGQRQRIGIARALAVEPEFIIADEPISALDVSIQAQVVNLLKRLQKERELTYLFIAHDLSMVQYISDRIGVMYRGRLVELAHSDELCLNPIHPYTQSLLSAIPLPDPEYERSRKRKFFDAESYMGEKEERTFREVSEEHWALCTEREFERYVAQSREAPVLFPY